MTVVVRTAVRAARCIRIAARILPAIFHVLLHGRVLRLLIRREDGVDLRIRVLLDRTHFGAAILRRKRAVATRRGELLLTILKDGGDLG